MAFTPTVTKVGVRKIGNNLYNVSIALTVNDGQADVFETTVSEKYNTGKPDLSGLKARLIAGLQEQWDQFAAEHNLFTAAAFDSMISDIQTAANSYIT